MKYETFVSSIANYYVKKNLIEEKQIDVFQYGASLTFASIISFTVAFAWGLIFHCFIEVIIFLAFFIPFRIFTGGYHANSFSRCVFSFAGILASLTLLINVLPDGAITPLAILGSIISIFAVYKYSPVQHPNAPVRDADVPKYRKISFTICHIEITVVSIALLIPQVLDNYRSLIIAAAYSLVIGSVLIFLAKVTSIKMEV